MEQLKKKTKLAIGISVIVLVVALIAAIVIFALNTVAKSTQLFGKVHTAVGNSVVDGVVVVNYRGDYCLVKGDDIISKKYTFLAPIKGKMGSYYFCDNSGYWGTLGNDGKEINRAKSNGVALKTDVFSYYLESEKAAAHFDEKEKELVKISGDKVYLYSEFNYLPGASEEMLPNGLVLYQSGNATFLESFNNVGKRLVVKSAAECYFTSFSVTTMTSEGYQSYYLNDLERIESLSGYSPRTTDTKYFSADSKTKQFVKVDVSDVTKVSVGSKVFFSNIQSPKAVSVFGNNAVLQDSENNAQFYNGATGALGQVSKLASLKTDAFTAIQVGNEVYNAELKAIKSGLVSPAIVSSISPNTIIADGDVFNSADGVTFNKMVTSAVVSNGYYVSGGNTIFNDKFEKKAVADNISVVKKGLFRSGSTYFNDKNNSVANVKRVIPCYFFLGSDFLEGVAFITDDNGVTTFENAKIESKAAREIGEISCCYDLNQSLVAVGKLGFCNEKGDVKNLTLRQSAIISGDKIVVSTVNEIMTFEVKNRIKEIDKYISYNCEIVSVDKYGVVFSATGKDSKTSLCGVINNSGKVIIKPMYQSIVLQDGFAVASTNLSEYRYGLISMSGKAITEFEYVPNIFGGHKEDFVTLTDSVLFKKRDGTYSFVTGVGKESLKKIIDYKELTAFKKDEKTEEYAPDKDKYYALYIGEGVRLLKYPG